MRIDEIRALSNDEILDKIEISKSRCIPFAFRKNQVN